MNTLTLTFADSADKAGFLRYVAKAKAQDGTVCGLHAGIMCSALKRAQVGESAAPDLLAVLSEFVLWQEAGIGPASDLLPIARAAIAAAKGA